MSTEIPTDILAFVAEVEASFSDVCKCGHSIPDDHCHGECEIDDCPCNGLPDLATELEQRVGQTVYLIAIVREQHAKLETPDGENLYDGCLCGEISPKDKPCLACAARLSQWDSIVAERDALRERVEKLEMLLCRTYKHMRTNVGEQCECVSCTLCRDIATELDTRADKDLRKP